MADESTQENLHWQYKKDRHTAYASRRSSLDDLAFKTSERYDQWVLALSGGGLAISIAFLEKIAPHPAPNTAFLLGLSWLTYILALLVGFAAIHYSREAIYDQIQIGDEKYSEFSRTSTPTKPEGDVSPERENKFRPLLSCLNKLSLSFLCIGTFLLCCFAFANLPSAKATSETSVFPQQIDVNVNILQTKTNGLGNTNITAKP